MKLQEKIEEMIRETEDYVGEIVETEYEFPENPELRNKVYVGGFIDGMIRGQEHCLNLLESYGINPTLKEKVLKKR